MLMSHFQASCTKLSELFELHNASYYAFCLERQGLFYRYDYLAEI
jgi:hypothetical protein